MKNIFKKLMLCLLIIPSMVFMVACKNAEPPTTPPGSESGQGGGGSQGGGDQSGGDQGGGDQSGGDQGNGDQGGEEPGDPIVDPIVAAKNAAYQIIHNLAKNGLNSFAIDKELDINRTVLSLDSKYDLNNVAMTEEEWDVEVEKKGLFSDFSRATQIPYYNGCYIIAQGSDGSGYYVEKLGEELDTLEKNLKEAVVVHGDKLVYFDNYYKSANYVDEDYAPHQYSYNFDEAGFNLTGVFEAIGQTDSYEGLTTSLATVLDGVNKYYNPDYVVEVPLDIVVDINILENSQYELVIKTQYETRYNGSVLVGLNKYDYVAYSNYVFTFDNNTLLSVDVKDGEYMFPMTWDYSDLKSILKGKSQFALDFDDVFNADSVVRSCVENNERLNIKFNEIDNTVFPTEETTSLDFDTLQNRKFHLYFYPVVEGVVQSSQSSYIAIEYGEQLVSPDNKYSNEEYDFFIDQALTQPIELGIIIPSYGIGSHYIYVVAKTNK